MQGSGRLLLLQAALTGFSLLTLTVIGDATPGHRYLKLRAATIWAGTLLILAVYPEQWILHTPGHLLTVLLGDVLLFAPVSALVEVRFPNTPPAAISRRENGRAAHRYSGFAVAAAIGLAVGVAAYASELSEKKTLPPLAKILFVGGLYVGLGACGLVIAYAFLGRLLGFSINEPPSAGGHFQV
jgi:hypothetical protein